MKTFEVGQRVWRSDTKGDLQEGRVVSFSPTGASMRVRWETGGNGIPVPYNRAERHNLLTDAQADAWRQRKMREREARSAWIAFDTAVRELNGALGRTYGATDEMTAKIRRTTDDLTKIIHQLRTETGQAS